MESPLYNAQVIDLICNDLVERGIGYESSMISNGFLFDEKLIKRAAELWRLRQIQITLDGTEGVYNAVKRYVDAGEKSPYQVVLANIRGLLDAGVRVIVRLNVSRANAKNLLALVDDLEARFAGARLLSVYCGMTSEFDGIDIVPMREDATKELFWSIKNLDLRLERAGLLERRGIKAKIPMAQCMADSGGSLTVLPDGHLGLCEHYSEDNFVGSIDSDELDESVVQSFRERGESEKLIEEFMLQANEAVAEFMCKREHPTVYRVHENPDPDKLRAFAQFARPFGYRIDPSKPEDTAQFQVVLRGAKNDPKQRVLPTLLLRSLARARYADECIGHYGLKAKFYLHFTSPIRRYPDLIAHRMLQKALTGEEFTAADENMCAEAAQQSTSREQAADNCERDIDKLFIAAYMKQFIGEEFDAEVSGVQSFGIFVALANGCEGLIRAELMTGDFYQYDEEHMAMVGRRTGKRFTIGTPLRVKLLAASEITGQIDFAPAEGSLPVSEKPERAPRDDDRPPFGNRASRRRHSHGRGRNGGQKGKKPPTRKRR